MGRNFVPVIRRNICLPLLLLSINGPEGFLAQSDLTLVTEDINFHACCFQVRMVFEDHEWHWKHFYWYAKT